MPDPDLTLLSKAQQQAIADSEVEDCWSLLLIGLRVGWYQREDIQELIDYLRKGSSFGIEELIFETLLNGRLKVFFLEEEYHCWPELMIEELEALLHN